MYSLWFYENNLKHNNEINFLEGKGHMFTCIQASIIVMRFLVLYCEHRNMKILTAAATKSAT